MFTGEEKNICWALCSMSLLTAHPVVPRGCSLVFWLFSLLHVSLRFLLVYPYLLRPALFGRAQSPARALVLLEAAPQLSAMFSSAPSLAYVPEQP